MALVKWVDRNRRELLEIVRSGDAKRVATWFADGAEPTESAIVLAEYLIAVRREQVATIGAHEVFVRRTDAGVLRQVIQPVTLALGDQSLYQIPIRRKFVLGTNDLFVKKLHKGKHSEWRTLVEDPGLANVAAEGYNRMNRVAGCSVQLPPSVIVDGERRPNPHIERSDQDIRRIVIACNVIGPTPATGNLVVVQYTLDLDPRADLVAMLLTPPWQNNDDDDEETTTNRAPQAPAATKLMPRSAYEEWRSTLEPTDRWRWHWLHLYGGVGVAHDLMDVGIQKTYRKFQGTLENTLKKAQTVARRNAMRAHPALAVSHVRVDTNGIAVVPVVGWASGSADVDKWYRALEALARGETVPGIETVEITDVYDPEADQTGDAAVDVQTPEREAEEAAPEPVDVRNELLAQLDQLALAAHPQELAEIGYPPRPDATAADLHALIGRLGGVLGGT